MSKAKMTLKFIVAIIHEIHAVTAHLLIGLQLSKGPESMFHEIKKSRVTLAEISNAARDVAQKGQVNEKISHQLSEDLRTEVMKLYEYVKLFAESEEISQQYGTRNSMDLLIRVIEDSLMLE